MPIAALFSRPAIFRLLKIVTFFAFLSQSAFAEGVTATLRYARRMSEAFVLEAAITPDSKTLITLNGNQTVGLWELSSGRLIKNIEGLKGRLMRVAVSGDGKLLATGAFSGEKVRIWSLPDGEFISEMAQFDDLASLALSHDGKLLAASGIPHGDKKDCSVELWDVTGGTRLAVLQKKPTQQFYPASLRFSPDGQHLAASVQNRSPGIMIWDVSTKKLVRSISHKSDVIAIDYSPDGSLIAGGGMDNRAHVWDAQTGRLLHSIEGHTSHITGASFHAGGRYFATSSFGSRSRFRIWDAQTGRQVFAQEKNPLRTNNVVFSRDGKTLAVVITTYGNLGDPATLEVYDINH